MAAKDLSRPEYIPVASIVGIHGNDSFVRHAGIQRVGAEQRPTAVLKEGDTVELYHMAPPPGVTTLSVHVAAWLEDLRYDEAQMIETEAEHLVTLGGHYLVDPPIDVKRDRVTNLIQRYRCSCAGFIMLCYASAGIKLVDQSPGSMPEVDFATVDQAYQISQYSSDRRRRLMSRFGLHGSGPWPLILPGYIFHSLLRPSAMVRSQPYVPRDSREGQFPSNRRA